MEKRTAFDNIQFSQAYPDGIDKHYWQIARSWIVAHELKKIQGKDSPTLEIGCGRGFVVKMLRAHGLNCHGIELAEVVPEKEMEPYVRTGISLENLLEVERQKYKTLLLLDVIEHIKDPNEFLQSILCSFPNATNLLITVPARAELWSNYDTYYGHFRRYSAPMLKELAQRIGFAFHQGSYAFRGLYIPAWFMARMSQPRTVALTSPLGISRFFHSLLGNLLRLDYLLLPSSLRGTSFVCLMKKQV